MVWCGVVSQRRERTQTNERNVKTKDRKNLRGYWRKLLIEGLEHFYRPWNIIRPTKSRTLKGADYVARLRQRKIWHISLGHSEVNTLATARCCVCISSANDRVNGVFWGLFMKIRYPLNFEGILDWQREYQLLEVFIFWNEIWEFGQISHFVWSYTYSPLRIPCNLYLMRSNRERLQIWMLCTYHLTPSAAPKFTLFYLYNCIKYI